MWYHIEKKIKTWLLKHLSAGQPTQCLNPEDIDWSSIHNILVIKQHDQFGDFLLTTPAIRALRLKCPKAKISLVVRNYLYPIAQGNPDVDKICIFYESAWDWTPMRIYEFKVFLRQPYDLAVVFNTVSHSFSSDMIAYFSRAKITLGPELPTFDHMNYNPFYSLNAPVDPGPKHQTLRNMDVVRYIGAETDDLSYRFSLSKVEGSEGKRVIRMLLGDNVGPVLAIHFGTKDPEKRYPIHRLAEIIDCIVKTGQYKIIVIPSPDEDELLNQLHNNTKCDLVVLPPMALRKVAAFLSNIDLLLCNDTGILHLASAVRTPSISFHARSDPSIWKPVGIRHVALYAKAGDIKLINVSTVTDLIQNANDHIGEGNLEIIPC